MGIKTNSNKLTGRFLSRARRRLPKIPAPEVIKMSYVIVGNSAAGITAAGTLRRLEPHARITVVDSDPHGAYARCMIPDVVA